MEDRTKKILEILNLFLVNEERSDDPTAPFKVRAYTNAIKAVQEYNKPITSKSDADYFLKNKLVGKKIYLKLVEIIETGELEEAKELQSVEAVREQLLNIHGIGPVKADELVRDYNVSSLDDLREIVLKDPEFLTPAQTLSLAYYSDLIQRIPRLEMMEHERYIRAFFEERIPEFNITIVGSYRRGEATSGDVDVLVSYHSLEYNEAREKFRLIIEELMESEYCIGTLSSGKVKYMGIVQLSEESLARRLDILLTKPQEFALSLLYFTGSQKFNVEMRKYARLKGYTLNEHQLSILPDFDNKGTYVPEPPSVFINEKHIFDFLGLKYLSPQERTGEIAKIE
jgi:DNA polymerase/3'-5' exonuclease PolX